MKFRKYQHVEKLGHDELEGILDGIVRVYPKLDGTNSSLWYEDGYAPGIRAGSRNRILSLEADNAGFFAWAKQSEPHVKFLANHPDLRLYGEWLVPHTLKTYREDAWRRFWIFDVYDETYHRLFPVEDYSTLFEAYGLDYIMPLARIQHPTEEQLLNIMNSTNTFLMQDGAGPGEGIVLKQYDGWRNSRNRQVWAKMVRNEFKEKNRKSFFKDDAVSQGRRIVEQDIVDEFCTEVLVKKELAKIVQSIANEKGDPTTHSSEQMIENYHRTMMSNRGKVIPRLLSTVFHCLIAEEMWAILKKFKNPTVDFKKLNRMVEAKVKTSVPELF